MVTGWIPFQLTVNIVFMCTLVSVDFSCSNLQHVEQAVVVYQLSLSQKPLQPQVCSCILLVSFIKYVLEYKLFRASYEAQEDKNSKFTDENKRRDRENNI